jgi:thermostable 8-oxoguanine DNA glycosylase
MSGPDTKPQESVKPEDDARLPSLEARIDREWSQFRPKFYKALKESIHKTAIWCIETLNQAQENGLNPDQGRELIRELETGELVTQETDRSTPLASLS